jgi:hypothetical protein
MVIKMRITRRALTDEDIEAHNAGEDEHPGNAAALRA